MNDDTAAAAHYAAFGQRDPILAALKKRGIALENLTPDDLAPFDQFHTGGAPATRALARLLAPRTQDRVLDAGSGLGGPARMLAGMAGCRVTGIDVTPHFIENARFFTELTRQRDRVQFEHGSVTALPFAEASFDGAWHLHVAMNVRDKAAMYRELFRVLRPGAALAIHDPVCGAAPMTYPVPWAADARRSFLVDQGELVSCLTAAGFAVGDVADTTAEGLDWYASLERARSQTNAPRSPTPLEVMTANHRANLTAGAVRIVTLVGRNPG